MQFHFRDKSHGWRNYSYSFEKNGDKKIVIPAGKTIFSNLFLNGYCLRPSCYNCAFRGEYNIGDLIIGDFWNIRNVYPDMDDDKGISSVQINTEAGNSIFEMCKDELVFRGLSVSDIYQPALFFSPKKPEGRDKFFSEFNKGDTLNGCFTKAKGKRAFLNALRMRMGLIRNVTKMSISSAYKQPADYWISDEEKKEALKSSCCGCSACKSICPRTAISMEYDNEGFLYPRINESLCIKCGLCKKACPIFSRGKSFDPIRAYACYAKADKIRLNSSSGGVFSILAKKIIENNGVVFGAASQFIDIGYHVKHISVDNMEDLEQLRGSKYVQSDMNICYSRVREFLTRGILVLFSGTPCQIAGLRSFLGKTYKNLITISVICHGVAPTRVIDRYISELLS